ncbi:hypothetical protein PAXINDRAFT_100409 [Paxillus involutus ATCC 200175]|uniref:F-box domain-containing protein n=1 Tax=Paxillus involutus ATCC 200175 TaxID=664439 RepID=A0A0C9SWF1_PAXIN|nr:hypothetical protein PAXINDRAFT_100409 [Paxillus involutus ATCC 200175]
MLRGSSACNKVHTDPLNVLGPELVGYIFQLWLLDSIYPHAKYSHSQLPVSLCLVSKSWRDFMYASPLLWTHLILEASQGAVPTLHALRARLERSQSAPLFLVILIGEKPDRDALRVLLAESSRFYHLTLGIFDLTWCDDIPIQGFTQLRKLTVHTGFQIPTRVDELSAVFSSAPCLCYVNWFSTGDPGLVEVNGHQLHFLDLTVFYLPVTRLLEVLAACPNLHDAVITFQGEHEYTPLPPRERILLPELHSFSLYGNRDLTGVLRGVQAPLLARFEVHWGHPDGHECDLDALQSLLAYSPHLEEISLGSFIVTEDGLISVITNNKNLHALTVTIEWSQTSFITHRAFELLTRQAHGEYALPNLEKLEFRGALDVADEVVLRMIESRMPPPDNVGHSPRSRRVCTLKSICLDGCKTMAEQSISRLESICEESGLKAEGTFATSTQISVSTSTIPTEAQTPCFSFCFSFGGVILWFRKLLSRRSRRRGQ